MKYIITFETEERLDDYEESELFECVSQFGTEIQLDVNEEKSK